MAANITETEVRYCGGWNITDAPDADLNAFITFGDNWITEKLGSTLSVYTTADAEKGSVAKLAEMYLVAYWFQLRPPPKDDFTVGPVSRTSTKATERIAAAESLLKECKRLLSIVGISYDSFSFIFTGGDDYHPNLDDDTQIDYGLAAEGSSNVDASDFNWFGMSGDGS